MIVRSASLALLLAGATACAAPLAAGGDAPAVPEPTIAAARAASERGALLYAYDRAAWLGSEAFAADELRLGDVRPLGYLVLPGKENALDFVVYGLVGGRGAAPMQIGRYPVVGDKVVGGDLAIAPLGERATRMIAARDAAAAALAAHGLTGCAEGRLNSIVLPPAGDGGVTVYLLTPMTAANSYPLARHFRFDVGAGGAVGDWRQVGATCETVRWDPADEDLAMRVEYVSAAAGAAHPDEIHSFIGHHVPVALGVVTGALVWPVLGGAISEPVAADPEMKRAAGE